MMKIEYQRRVANHRRIIVTGIFAFVICVAAAGLKYRKVLGSLRDKIDLLSNQRKCLNYAVAPDVVVYETDDEASKVLIASGRYGSLGDWTSPAMLYVPEWERFHRDWEMGFLEGIVFLHGRTCAYCSERLVAVRPQFFALDQFNLSFQVLVFRPASLFHPPELLRNHLVDVGLPTTPEQRTTFFAGQADHDDLSRFSIDVDIATQSYTVVGVLHADDTVTLDVKRRPTIGH